MQPVATYSGAEPCLEIANSEYAVQEIQRVVAYRLPSLYRNAYRFLGNAADAEDAVQDALLLAYKHLGQFRGQSQLSTWLNAIVSNCARMQLRRRPRHLHMSLDEPIGEEQEYCLLERLADNGPNPEDECRSSELNERVRELATQLSPSLRRAFQLRDLDGLTTSEAASVLGVSEGTLKAQLSRARTKLKRLMRMQQA
jgi:RNA polymerase sigma-70 factor (ECF subfamily)